SNPYAAPPQGFSTPQPLAQQHKGGEFTQMFGKGDIPIAPPPSNTPLVRPDSSATQKFATPGPGPQAQQPTGFQPAPQPGSATPFAVQPQAPAFQQSPFQGPQGPFQAGGAPQAPAQPAIPQQPAAPFQPASFGQTPAPAFGQPPAPAFGQP